ncbi:MAG: peptidyl-tRNA hydrolase Pth2 [Candidatus Odinarchaeum yellowstonii]|uniref:Peptidyl-tRNA hydrolase n=1 Tax=Odinarchaeota yellowstonii (strain LCB_4) TaxID=1841599 RepID=A0AAF0D129_ODILC|nr:MAG: peptidyl-tRNA hydrolase Pth2 [Candidatus Odinarchaeum yellowstonii]
MNEFQYKQVLVIRVDLNMSRGKIAVQAAHAAVAASEEARRKYSKWWLDWLNEGQRKIAVKVKTLDELLDLKLKAKEAQLPYSLIEDRGLTEVPPGTITALGIGPAPANIVDKLTSHLPLL